MSGLRANERHLKVSQDEILTENVPCASEPAVGAFGSRPTSKTRASIEALTSTAYALFEKKIIIIIKI